MSGRSEVFDEHLANHRWAPTADCAWCAPGLPAPAVPVGVQPEPAEGCACGADFLHGPHDGPAVPVVHPEPGDRAVRACARCGASYRWYPRTATTTETFSHLIGPSDGHMPVLHATDAGFYLAAAVAAVRADRLEALALHTGLHQCIGGSWYSDNDPTYHGTVARHAPCPTAAALRGMS